MLAYLFYYYIFSNKSKCFNQGKPLFGLYMVTTNFVKFIEKEDQSLTEKTPNKLATSPYLMSSLELTLIQEITAVCTKRTILTYLNYYSYLGLLKNGNSGKSE